MQRKVTAEKRLKRAGATLLYWVAPAHPRVLPACRCHLLPLRICRSLKTLIGLASDAREERAPEQPRISQPSPQFLVLSPKTASCPGTVTARNNAFWAGLEAAVDCG